MPLQEIGIPDGVVSLAGGTTVRVLDVLDVPCRAARPAGHQRENACLDIGHRWRKVGRIGWEELSALVEPEAPLWASGDSSARGLNNRVLQAQLSTPAGSLRLIRIPALSLLVDSRLSGGRTRIALRARFGYAGEDYCMDVTDPLAESRFRIACAGRGIHRLEGVIACISLGSVFQDGRAYKLMASLLTAGGYA